MWKVLAIASLGYALVYILYAMFKGYPLDISHDWQAFVAVIIGFFFGALALRKESTRK